MLIVAGPDFFAIGVVVVNRMVQEEYLVSDTGCRALLVILP